MKGMSKRDVLTLGLLVITSVFLFADQNIINPVIEDVVQEYGVDREKIGLLGSAFFVLGALISLLFGFLTDKYSRKVLFAVVVLVGEIPCLLTGFEYFTRTYEQLLVLRVLTGIGVGGIFPLTFSMLGDYFRPEHRPVANAWIGVAWAIGQVLGQTLAGFLVEDYGWRLPFLLIAAPNFVLVPLFLAVAREPKRGQCEDSLKDLIDSGGEYAKRITLADLGHIFTNRTNLLSFLQGIPGCIPWGVLPFFLIDFYRTQKGFPVSIATTLTLVFGIGATLGGLFGGFIGEWLYKRGPKLVPISVGTAILVGTIPWFLLLGLEFPADPGWSSFPLPAIVGFIAGAVVTYPSPNVKAVLMNVNPPERRGSTFAVFNLTDSVGKGIGPFIGGVLITSLGYAEAMAVSVAFWIPTGIVYLLIARTFQRDIDGLDAYLRARAEELRGKPLEPAPGADAGGPALA
jgi:MFS family permease